MNQTEEYLAYLIAVLDQNGRATPLHPADVEAAKGRALTIWEQDGAVWLRSDPRPEGAA